jgi:hypothetical protein
MVQPLSIREVASVSRIAACLAPHVTHRFIEELNHSLGFRRLEAPNKIKKIQILVTSILEDGRSRHRATEVIEDIVGEAHHRTVAGKAGMTYSDADTLLEAIKTLGIPVGDLGRPEWRAGLKPSPIAPATSPTVSAEVGSDPRPLIHPEALKYIRQLAADESNPQSRGRELEKVLASVIAAEGLRGTHNIVGAGEQIDVAFVLDGQNYLLESRWQKERQGQAAVREFSDKVRRKAEGTFGVLVSMSAFAESINATAAQGARLNSIGLTSREVMAVIEGRATFAGLVRAARSRASTRGVFYEE